jgi:hypothetical protein
MEINWRTISTGNSSRKPVNWVYTDRHLEHEMADFTNLPQAEQGKLLFDLYKLRVEEFRGRYESMRELEWKILFQMYGGYAAIAVVYEHLQVKSSTNQILLSYSAIVATLVFYAAARYLTFRIQERLIKFDTARDKYVRQMHVLLQCEEETPIPLGHRYHWSYHTQLILSTLTCLYLVGYESTQGLTFPFRPPITVGAVVAGVVITALLLSMKIKWKVSG